MLFIKDFQCNLFQTGYSTTAIQTLYFKTPVDQLYDV